MREQGKAANPLDNPAFRRWFGESKVVDARGAPLVVYHGGVDVRKLAVPAFLPSPVGKYGAGVYTTPDLPIAESYLTRGGVVLSLYVRVERPLRVYLSESEPLASALERASGARQVAALQRDRQPMGGASSGRPSFGYGARASALLQDAGFDGVFVFPASSSRRASRAAQAAIVLAFASTQVKSATDNDGSYDADDPSILSGSAD